MVLKYFYLVSIILGPNHLYCYQRAQFFNIVSYHQLHLQRMATTVMIDSGAFLTSKSHIILAKKLPSMEWSHLVGFLTSGSVCTLVCLLFGAFPLLIMKELAFLLNWCGPSLYSSFQSYSNSIVSRCPW